MLLITPNIGSNCRENFRSDLTSLFFLSEILVWKIIFHWRNWGLEKKIRATFFLHVFIWDNITENTTTATVLFIGFHANGNFQQVIIIRCVKHISEFLLETLFNYPDLCPLGNKYTFIRLKIVLHVWEELKCCMCI